jgi:hypothetical protein
METSKRNVKNSDSSFVNYDAYDKDIALVHFYFKKPTIIYMKTKASMSWNNFFSEVGSITGLVIGLGIILVSTLQCLQSVAKPKLANNE